MSDNIELDKYKKLENRLDLIGGLFFIITITFTFVLIPVSVFYDSTV